MSNKVYCLKTPFRTKAVSLATLAVASCFLMQSPNSLANPTGGAVVNGSAAMSQQGNLLAITSSPNAIINWQSFSIGTGEITRFIQQSSASAVLNQVKGLDPSVILGALQSNGRVFLINPNGILFGAGSQVNVAGLVASTLNLSNDDFLAGKYKFTATTGAGSVINQGAITTPGGGQVYLVAPDVQNTGIINSPQGDVMLAAGHSVELVDAGTPQLKVQIDASDTTAVNLGQIIADSGRIGIYAGLIKNSGTLRADGAVVGEGGQILLRATQGITTDATSVISASGTSGGGITLKTDDGATLLSGSVEAKGSDTTGGTVEVLGTHVGLMDYSLIDVSGQTGGGNVKVGGDFHGANADVQNAAATYVSPTAVINADAIASGDGGNVAVWAEDTTRFYGTINARGGSQSGNGGFVETSGHSYLDFNGLVNTGAAFGKSGTLLLDPSDVVITNTIDGLLGGGFLSGIFSGASGTATLTWVTIALQLISSNVVITTSGTGGSGNITVNNATTQSTSHNLSLLANNNVVVNDSIGNSGSGSISLVAGWDGVSTSSPTVNSGTGNLVLNLNGPQLTTSGGNINLLAGSAISITGSASNNVLDSGGGNINMTVTGGTGGVNIFAPAGLAFINVGAGALNVSAGSGGLNFPTTNGAVTITSNNPTTGFTADIVNVISNQSSVTLNAKGNVGTLNLNGGTLDDAANSPTNGYAWNISSAFNWSANGLVTNNAVINVLSSASLSMSGPTQMNHTAVVNNAGNASMGGGSLFIGDDSKFNNQVGATFGFLDDSGILLCTVSCGTSSVFANAGNLVKGNGSGVSGISGGSVSDFSNSGQVNVTSGTLQLATATGTDSGGYFVTSGATLDMNSGTRNITGPAISGTGTLRASGGTVSDSGFISVSNVIVSGGTLNANGGTNSANITLSSGTLAGSSNIVASNSFNWSGGSMSGSSQTNIGSGATLNFGASGSLSSSRPINSDGTVNIISGTLAANNGFTLNAGTLNISSGAALNFGTANFFWNAGTIVGAGSLLNSGGFFSLSGSGARVLNGPSLSLPSLALTAGSLDLQSGSLSVSGTSIVSSGATFIWDGGTYSPTGNITNNGTFTINSGAGDLNMGAAQRFDNMGTFNANGSHQIGSGASSIFNNAGVVNATGGTLSMLVHDTDLSGAGGDTGSYTVGTGATLRFRDALRDFLPSSSITGAGNVQFDAFSGGIFNINGTYAPTGQTTITGNPNVNFNSNVMLNNLTLNATGTALAGTGNIIINGTLNWTAGSIAGSGIFRTAGGATISGTGAKTLSGRSWDNTGGTSINGGSVTVSSAFTNPGTIVIGSSLILNQNFDNTGTIQLSSGTLKANTGVTAFSNSGLLEGNGTVDVSTASVPRFTNNGTISPGFSPGTININGDYTQSSSGVLDEQLGGTSPGSYDVLNVSGIATLNGTMALSLYGGYTGTAGDSYTPVTAGTLSGTFSSVQIPVGYLFTTSYSPAQVMVQLGSAAAPVKTFSGNTNSDISSADSTVMKFTGDLIREMTKIVVADTVTDKQRDEPYLKFVTLSCR